MKYPRRVTEYTQVPLLLGTLQETHRMAESILAATLITPKPLRKLKTRIELKPKNQEQQSLYPTIHIISENALRMSPRSPASIFEKAITCHRDPLRCSQQRTGEGPPGIGCTSYPAAMFYAQHQTPENLPP